MHTPAANNSQCGGAKAADRNAALLSDSMLPAAAIAAYAPKQHVFCEGDAKRNVYRVDEGAVSLYKTTVDGKRQVFGFALPGDIIGLGASEAYSYNAQALGCLRLRSLPVPSLNRLAAQDPQFALKLYQAVSLELEATQSLLMAHGRHDAVERVAIFLLGLSNRNAQDGKNPSVITLPMTRLDIGDLLGLSIETVSRSLSKLRKLKKIDVIRATTVQIIDLDGLNALAGHATYH